MSPLTEINTRIKNAALRSGRDPDSIRLIAVSKTKPLHAVQSLAEEGQIDFGENRIQDAETKIPYCQELTWHFIGHLQSNKTKYIPELFDWVHTIDRLKLVKRINDAAKTIDKTVNVLLQVNVANDDNKAGVSRDQLLPLAEQILSSSLENIALKGLMTIGYQNASAALARNTFADLRTLADSASSEFGSEYFNELSMGMSGDFEIAIEEGATMVRVGTDLFGPR